MDLLRTLPAPAAAHAHALAVCAPRDLQVWQPADALWSSAAAPSRSASPDDDEDEETADDSADGDGSDEQLAVKEEQAPLALRSLASAASHALSGESPSRLRARGEEAKPKKKRVFKKRKPTHTVRKEEKQALLAEIELLQARLDELKFQALVDKGEAAKTVARQTQSNRVLRESIEEHHVAFARVQSLLSGYVQQSLPRIHPTKVPIMLGLDRGERHRTLMAMKDAKLREAWRFMVDRTAHLEPETPFYEEERYNSREGDYCVVRLDVVPLTGIPSVQAILTALRRAIANAEIIISEISGNITIREDDNHGEASLMQARLVSSTHDGTFVESNSVSFSEYFADGDYAVIAGDYVDEDLLYPYRPQSRVRRDGTSILTVTPRYVDRRQVRREPGEFHCGARTGYDEDGRELVIILKRWAAWKFHHTDLAVSDNMLRNMRDAMGRWGETILESVRESLAYMAEHDHHMQHAGTAF